MQSYSFYLFIITMNLDLMMILKNQTLMEVALQWVFICLITFITD